MYILGISCFYHDSATALISDGEIIAAAQEERFTRKKHDFAFPKNAVEFCLNQAQITIDDIAYIAFYDKPLVKFERILETSLSVAPKGLLQFLQAVPLWIKQKLWIPDIIAKELEYNGKVLFCEHHESHAASAFYPSPFEKAAFLTLDGVGEWETASFGRAQENDFKISHTLHFPHSLGLLYSSFTYYCGFRVNSGEYKLMGLAPYGEPKYADLIFSKLIDLKNDGSFKMNLEYFGYCDSLKMTNRKFEELFGMPARLPESEITQFYMDIAKSIQLVTEEIMLRMANHVYKETGEKNLCLAGGVALNCVGNGKILREGPFENIWIQPASGDAGGALGAALRVWYKYLDNPREAHSADNQRPSCLGNEFSDEEIEKNLKKLKAEYKKMPSENIAEETAALIEQGNIIGWFQGKMEFGPRALGARSIIADPRSQDMQSKLNLKIKFRESFRPFAPSVLKEHIDDYFDLKSESPYMLLVAPVKENKRFKVEDEDLQGIEKLKSKRSDVPAITHVDYSARVQSVQKEDLPLYYDTIKAFYKKSGCPLVINTSFNVRGEPIVCTPQDAFICFMRTDMDYLVIGSFLLKKQEQSNQEKYKKFEVDLILD